MKIKGLLQEQKHHSDTQPVLIGELVVEKKKYGLAGWIYYNADGTISISLVESSLKRPKNSQ